MVSVDPSLARCSAPDFTASASARASGSSRLASSAMVPSKETCWVSKVTCRLSADLASAFSTSSGMYRTRASSTSRPNADGREPGGAPEHLLVHIGRGLQGEGEGGLRDQPRPPPRDQARLDRGPQPGEAVGDLDAVGEEPPRTVVGATQHGRELRHAELIDRRRPLTGERLRGGEARLGELGVREVQVGPVHRQAHQLDVGPVGGLLRGRAPRAAARPGCPAALVRWSMTWLQPIRDHRHSDPEKRRSDRDVDTTFESFRRRLAWFRDRRQGAFLEQLGLVDRSAPQPAGGRRLRPAALGASPQPARRTDGSSLGSEGVRPR